ncbi:hypothetical protein LCGC14_0696840 [marine sediment metagenome]|uniref:Uncharacterized protein n=1 Tax=marine sediment metagenome TaxID=412755 RepID=A0A0F9TRR2_9ZZZZ
MDIKYDEKIDPFSPQGLRELRKEWAVQEDREAQQDSDRCKLMKAPKRPKKRHKLRKGRKPKGKRRYAEMQGYVDARMRSLRGREALLKEIQAEKDATSSSRNSSAEG